MVAFVVVVVVVAGVVVVVAGVVVVVAFVVVVMVVAGMVVVVMVIVVVAGIFEQRLRLNAFQAMVPQQIWTVANGDSHGSFLLAVQGASPKQSATHLRFTCFDDTSDEKERVDRGT